jgi:hypothetical protein
MYDLTPQDSEALYSAYVITNNALRREHEATEFPSPENARAMERLTAHHDAFNRLFALLDPDERG